jgi:hypothetical protein
MSITVAGSGGADGKSSGMQTSLYEQRHLFGESYPTAYSIFTNEQAHKFLHKTGDCKLCLGFKEDNSHIFFNCIFARYTWNTTSVFYHKMTQTSIYRRTNNLLELLDQSLGHSTKRTTRLLVLYETLFSIWKSRNTHTFQDLARDTSPKLIAHSAALHARALLLSTKGEKKKKRLIEAQQTLELVSTTS